MPCVALQTGHRAVWTMSRARAFPHMAFCVGHRGQEGPRWVQRQACRVVPVHAAALPDATMVAVGFPGTLMASP